ncbi:Anti-sigma F factor antagonist [Lacipirellula limnantheis]|uniref:Anti-sigma F factor antagonist n=2 Tax=Lacipirellula limnantheis TaxID=2528024 RepID=A0A517U067_9BACT|nr:Anti-sigma F factor antagonist [Lacipirellula limnantheis]
MPSWSPREAYGGRNVILPSGFIMPINSYAKDDILTIRILDERLIDPEQLKRLFDDLYALLGKSEEQQVVLDFGSVKFMASAMLGKLVAMKKKCDEFKAKLKLCSVSPEILEVFKITKLNKVFDIQSDDAAARKSFTKRGFFG